MKQIECYIVIGEWLDLDHEIFNSEVFTDKNKAAEFRDRLNKENDNPNTYYSMIESILNIP